MKTESEYSSFSPQQPSRRRGLTEILVDGALSVVQLPITLASSLVSTGLETLRPFSPQLVPLLICTLLIPIVVFFSLISGLLLWKSLAVGWEVPLYLQYGDGVQPYAQTQIPSLVSSQPYDISLQLVVPASPSNLALGNFMTELALTTPSNGTLLSVRRPAIATPPRSFFLFPTSLTTEISVPLLAAFTPGMTDLVASVTIGRKDNWRSIGAGEGRELSVLSATLQGTVVHQGVRGLLTRFPFALSCAAAGAFFLTCMAVIAACLLPVALSGPLDLAPPSSPTKPSPPARPPPPPKALSDSETDSSSDDDFPSPRRRLSRRTSREVKHEAPIATIKDEPESSSTPLRRRRSKIADTGSQSEGSS